jgi:putative effector of murein hydrolase LrgA (UPF0299 family)
VEEWLNCAFSLSALVQQALPLPLPLPLLLLLLLLLLPALAAAKLKIIHFSAS